MLECERDPVARVGMIYGLNRLGQSWRLDQLLGLLEMDNPLVRENALNILDPSDLRGNDPEKLAIRLRALTETDGDPAVIAAAAAILNELASGV